MPDLNSKDAVQITHIITCIIRNRYLDDCTAIEEIVNTLTAYGINCGFRQKAEKFIMHTE